MGASEPHTRGEIRTIIMFDFLRDLTKPAAEKRREQLHAYLDGELGARDRQAIEQQLAQDSAWRAELAALRETKESLRQLPRLRAPRNFTLDPAVYGAPEPDRVMQLYPVLRAATALTALLLVILVSGPLLLGTPAAQPAAEVFTTSGLEADADSGMDAGDGKMTRVVAETAAEEEALEFEEREDDQATERAADEGVAEEPAEEPMEEEAEAEVATELAAPVVTDTAEGEVAVDMAEAAPPAAATAVVPAESGPEADTEQIEPQPPARPVEQAQPFISSLTLAQIVVGALLIVLLVALLFVRRQL